jgi:hypothetical protein
VMHGLEQERFLIVPGSWRARFTVFLGRTFPRLMARVTDSMIAKGLKS